MWTCLNCGEKVEDNFTECWNCRADREGGFPEAGDLATHEMMAASNIEVESEYLSQMNCLRCGNRLARRGEKDFETRGLIFESTLSLKMYSCPHCGHVEFFSPGFPEQGS